MTLRPILRDFALAYPAALALMAALVAGIALAGGPEVGGGIAMVPAVAAVFFAGQRHAQRGGAMPRSGEAWRIGFALFAAALAFNAVLTGLWVAFALAPEDRAALLALARDPARSEFRLVAGIVSLSFLAVLLLAMRYLFPFAVRSGLKAMARAGR